MESITTDRLRRWAEALKKGQANQIVPDFKKGVEFASDILTLWAKHLDEYPEQEQPTAPMLQMGKDGMFYPCPMPVQQEPSPLEVALRLIESGKCPAIPTQARAAAFALIDAVGAEEARRAGK